MATNRSDTVQRTELERRLREILTPDDEVSTALLIEILTTPVSGAVSDCAKAAARAHDVGLLAGALRKFYAEN